MEAALCAGSRPTGNPVLSRDELVEGNLTLCDRLVSCLLGRRHIPGLERDDLLQEAHIGLIQAADSYQSSRGASFETHATTCITNALRMVFRRAGVQPVIQPGDLATIEETNNAGAVDQGFEAAENRIFIQQTMSELPDRQREAIDLHYLQDVPQAQVATRMNVSERHLRRLLSDGLGAMRQMAN